VISGKTQPPVWFCTNVGGGIFGSWQTAAWRGLGLDARLHSAIGLADYWRAKSGALACLRLRWGMYVSYPWRLRKAVRCACPGEIFVTVTNPFFLPALAARAARQSGARIIHLVYDLYPDALEFGGGWSRRHPAARFAAFSTRAAIAQCAATVYLGKRLRGYAEVQYGVAQRTAVIPVGTDTTIFRNCAPTLRGAKPVHCLYSGHLGRLHDWGTLAQALALGLPDGLTIEIAADGPGARELKDALSAKSLGERILLSGTRNESGWRAAMLAADVALVTMAPGAEKVVMPSKTYSAMAAGQAILAICPKESDLADLITAHDCGWVIEPDDHAGLQARLSALASDREGLLVKRCNAYNAAHTHYSMEALGKQWLDLLASLDGN
jgi:glycosyltransferase involved in cell wall biosynthesis